jgi:hypothetical protein
MKTQYRYWLLGLLFVISASPQVLVLPLLGSINLLFLVLLWILLCVTILFGPRVLAVLVALLLAVAMAVPPAPNYLWPSNSGALHFQFIGWGNVFHGLYGVVFFFVLYLVLFELAALFVRKQPLPVMQ